MSGPLRDAVGGAAAVDVEAATIRELLGRLVDRYPRLEAQLDAGIAVAINGEIFRDNWSEPIPAGAEVVLMPRIQGG
ncbi:MAG: MoaD/ThiS family protein [Pseudomonadales bacterium]|nr:MoaD/ThiS family protein [Pseudomonadales bacterium]